MERYAVAIITTAVGLIPTVALLIKVIREKWKEDMEELYGLVESYD